MENLLLTAQEVADVLKISRALAYQWMRNGTLPALRAPVGCVVRVPKTALEQWIETHTRYDDRVSDQAHCRVPGAAARRHSHFSEEEEA